jgi:LmbE family N-acetylglucosaminyl deacetylase
VIAVSGVTCLVLAAAAPTTFAGRGSGARLSPLREATPSQEAPQSVATTCIDVSEFVGQKMAALVSHRTQYPIPANIFPREMLVKMFGYEYFKRIDPPMELESDLCPPHIHLYGAASSSVASIRGE